MIVILELAGTTRPEAKDQLTRAALGELVGPSVDAAERIADRLIGHGAPKREIELRQDGEIAPKVAFQLTQDGATFTLSGTSRLVTNRLERLSNDDIGVGARVDAGGGKVLVVTSCAQFPQPTPPKPASNNGASDDAGFDRVLDVGLKLMSLAVQTWPSP